MAVLGSAATEALATESAFSVAFMEWHRGRALHPHDERDRQRAGLSKRALQSCDAGTDYLDGFGPTIDRRPTPGGSNVFVSRLSGRQHRPGAESRSGRK